MYLKHIPTGDLIEIIDLHDVINPASPTVRARSYIDETIQRPDDFPKAELAFPSGEPLPVCWVDSQYNEHAAA